MDLGIQKVVNEGNGNTILYTALIAGGFVVGAVNKNIEVNKQAELKKQQKV